MVADIIEHPVKRMTHAMEVRQRVHADALLIGIRPAARKHGVNEKTACTWALREHWKLPECLITLRCAGRRSKEALKTDEGRLHALDQLAASIDEQGEHSRLYLSASTLQASHQLAQDAGKTQGERVPYAGLLNVARTGDVVNGWTARNTAPPQVAVQVVMPTPEERAKLDATDAMLDAITKRLTAPA